MKRTAKKAMTVMNYRMRRYEDYKDLSDIEWARYKIVVPTDADKLELRAAFKHMHDSDVDTDFVVVNQLVHEYRDKDVADDAFNNIVVSKKLFDLADGSLAGKIKDELFKRHTHAELAASEPDQIVYREKDVLAILRMAGIHIKMENGK